MCHVFQYREHVETDSELAEFVRSWKEVWWNRKSMTGDVSFSRKMFSPSVILYSRGKYFRFWREPTEARKKSRIWTETLRLAEWHTSVFSIEQIFDKRELSQTAQRKSNWSVSSCELDALEALLFIIRWIFESINPKLRLISLIFGKFSKTNCFLCSKLYQIKENMKYAPMPEVANNFDFETTTIQSKSNEKVFRENVFPLLFCDATTKISVETFRTTKEILEQFPFEIN